jgi:tetratricopeptide (TPR) repeat protein
MTGRELMRSHKYAQAIAELRRGLEQNPEDMACRVEMAKALRAKGKYSEALLQFERLAQYEEGRVAVNFAAPGRAAWLIEVASLHWLTEDHSGAIRLMHGLAAGILDGSIKYGDAAGGMSQGLLLYYMAVSEKLSEEASFALDYLRNRVTNLTRIDSKLCTVWPCPVAQYYLEDIPFEKVIESVNHRIVSPLLDEAKAELGKRRRLTVALFHEGARNRAHGDEERCLARMRECCALEDTFMEQESYFARYEVQKANNRST